MRFMIHAVISSWLSCSQVLKSELGCVFYFSSGTPFIQQPNGARSVLNTRVRRQRGVHLLFHIFFLYCEASYTLSSIFISSVKFMSNFVLMFQKLGSKKGARKWCLALPLIREPRPFSGDHYNPVSETNQNTSEKLGT